MKRFLKYLLFAFIAFIVIGTFAFLFKNSQPKADKYTELTAVRRISCVPPSSRERLFPATR